MKTKRAVLAVVICVLAGSFAASVRAQVLDDAGLSGDRLEAVKKGGKERANRVEGILDKVKKTAAPDGVGPAGVIDRARNAALETRDAVKNLRESALEGVKKVRENARDAVEMGREDIKAQARQAREGLMQKRVELKGELEEKKAEARALFGEKKAELQKKLLLVKDERKRAVVERLADKFGAANERVTGVLTRAVDRMEGIVDRIEGRANELEGAGADVAALRAAIAEANGALERARLAIAEQAGRVYAVSDALAAGEAAREDLAALHARFKSDVESVREIVNLQVHEAVRRAATALKGVVRPNQVDGD